jgi:hypothetical protein
MSDFRVERNEQLRKHEMAIRPAMMALILLSAAAYAMPARAQQHCHREGPDVTCDDGHRGVWSGDSIIWADGTKSRSVSSHPSVIIGNKDSVRVGPGVFVGQGKGMVPLDDPSRTRCVILDQVSYCN